MYTWYDPTGQEIDYHSLEKYDIREEVEGQLKVTINHASLQDMGEYTFNVRVISKNTGQAVSKNISLPLIIIKQPPRVCYSSFIVSWQGP